MTNEILLDKPTVGRSTRVNLCRAALDVVLRDGEGLVSRDDPYKYTPLYCHLIVCSECKLQVLETRVISEVNVR